MEWLEVKWKSLTRVQLFVTPWTNSSTGILSPPLALFIVMLSKVHLTSHSGMSGSRWVIIPSWLSWSWRSFLCNSSVYSCHVFLISSASVSSITFLSFIEPIFAWNVPLVSLIFLKRSLVSLFVHTAIFKMDNQQNLLYRTRNSAECYGSAWKGGEFGGEWIHVYECLSSFTVPLKLYHNTVIP